MRKSLTVGLLALFNTSLVVHQAGAFLIPSTPPVQTSFGLQQTWNVFCTRLDATTGTSSTTSSTSASQGSTLSDLALENDVILYDGVCNFCNTWVDILLRIDVKKKFRFAPLQSRIGQELLVSIGKQANDISSVVLIKAGETGESFDKSRCVLKVVEELGPVAALASRAALTIVPEGIRDGIYDTVAENRYNLMGKRDECRCSDPQFADRFLLD